jgi:hypothetical protein
MTYAPDAHRQNAANAMAVPANAAKSPHACAAASGTNTSRFFSH